MRLYAGNFLKKETLLAVSDDLKKLELDSSNQVADEHLGIGTDTWISVAELEQEYDTKPFFSAVRNFYLATIQKISFRRLSHEEFIQTRCPHFPLLQ